MTVSDGLMILAVLLAPFVAVFVQRNLDLWREKRERKLSVFQVLMATRAAGLSAEHVRALNTIDLQFTGKSEKPVRDAWKEYRDHLYSFPREEGEDLAQRQRAWQEKSPEFLASLLQRMGFALGYDFDAVEIKKGAYHPEAYGAAELESLVLRRRLVEWLVTDKPVSVSVVPADDAAREQGKTFLDSVLALLHGSRRLKVDVRADQGCSPGPEVDPGKARSGMEDNALSDEREGTS